MNEADLLSLAAAGHGPAFSALYRRHCAYVARFLHGVVGRREDVEAAVLETFLAARRCLAEIEAPSHLRPWLAQLAIERCGTPSEGGSIELGWDRPPSTTDGAAAALCETLHETLQALPPKLRTAWLLHGLGELSPYEISRIVGTKSEIVMRRIASAERRLARRGLPPHVIAMIGRAFDVRWHDLARMRVLRQLRAAPIVARQPRPRPKPVPTLSARTAGLPMRILQGLGFGVLSAGLFVLGWWMSTLLWPLLSSPH